ncbi:MAG: acetylxylan esterase [Candidatus Aenigmarchaeota archaeon]|nr:acetylxylan esterase [Candidatus Aenigmarchaeota archaeon]
MRPLALAAVAVLLCVAAAAVFLSLPAAPASSYVIEGNRFQYTLPSPPAFTQAPLPGGAEKVTFASRGGATIFGLFEAPNGSGPFPAFVVLPGASVEKEAEQAGIARDLRRLGFATLTLDQRATGETGGSMPSLQAELASFQNRNEPANHQMVADALLAARLLQSWPEVDDQRVGLAGVSMGGRIAIIAGVQDPSIWGVVGVSTGGIAIPPGIAPEAANFVASISPDTYVADLAPRPLLLIHGLNDTVIPPAAAEITFQRAGEPKQLLLAEGGHGYYTQFDFPLLQAVLQW